MFEVVRFPRASNYFELVRLPRASIWHYHPFFCADVPPSLSASVLFSPVKQHWLLKAKLNTRNVDGVTADGDAIPTLAHGTVGGAQGLLQAHLFNLQHVIKSEERCYAHLLL